MVHGGPAAPSSIGARRAVPRGTKAHCGSAGRERATVRSPPRPKLGGEVAPVAERNVTRRRCSVLGGSGHG
jgi:hypothetical protein